MSTRLKRPSAKLIACRLQTISDEILYGPEFDRGIHVSPNVIGDKKNLVIGWLGGNTWELLDPGAMDWDGWEHIRPSELYPPMALFRFFVLPYGSTTKHGWNRTAMLMRLSEKRWAFRLVPYELRLEGTPQYRHWIVTSKWAHKCGCLLPDLELP